MVHIVLVAVSPAVAVLESAARPFRHLAIVMPPLLAKVELFSTGHDTWLVWEVPDFSEQCTLCLLGSSLLRALRKMRAGSLPASEGTEATRPERKRSWLREGCAGYTSSGRLHVVSEHTVSSNGLGLG